MKIEITSTAFYDFVEKYGEKLAPYHLEIKNNGAYISNIYSRVV